MSHQIKTLENTPFGEITRCFNEAFSDYFVKFNATEDYLRTRWKVAGVDYSLSFGCFLDGRLIGFIIHGIRERDGQLTAFNCATGIEPAHQTKGLLGQMYETAIPALRQSGVTFTTLEVIATNERAIRAYEKAGFRRRPGLLHCFTGELVSQKLNMEGLQTVVAKTPAFSRYAAMRDYEPSWEMTDDALATLPGEFQYRELHLEAGMAGYLIFSPKRGLVQQFGVHPGLRRRGLGTLLFDWLAADFDQIRVVNVPESAAGTVAFLKKLGFKNNLDQYEMEREV
jgi:ribosomal protein S18 acetylase RimI-like enzyme